MGERTSLYGWVVAGLLIAVAVGIQPAWALPSRVHAVLAYEAARMPGVPAEIGSDAIVGTPDNPIGDDLDNDLCEGAFDEDYDRIPRTILDYLDWSNRDLIWGQGNHFWDPAQGPAGGQLRLMNPPPRQNAYQRATMLYGQAVALYPTDHLKAYYLLGRVVHLLTDMATPAHTHLDAHVSDQLAITVDVEGLAADSFERYLGANYVTRLDMPSDPDPTGRLRFEQDLIASPIEAAKPVYLSDGGYPQLGDLYKLFYSMARQAARWDSNDRNGTGSQGIGGGSIRWRREIDVAFTDASTLQVWTVDAGGHESAVSPIATVRNARILLPDVPYDSYRWIKVAHDGTSNQLPSKQVHDIGQISDADCGRMARDLMPKAIAHTEALYRLFWRDTHPGDLSLDSAKVTGDVDGDGFVSLLDALIVLKGLGANQEDAGFDSRADLDASGRIDVADLLTVASHFGQTR